MYSYKRFNEAAFLITLGIADLIPVKLANGKNEIVDRQE